MKYFRNTSWLFCERILRIIAGLSVGIWLARYLGPEQFGLFNYAQSFVGLFTAIATLGLDGIVVRELVKDENRRDELICTAFCLRLIGAVFVLLILAVMVNFTSNDSRTNRIVFIIASATVFQSLNVIDLYFQSKVMGKYIVYSNVLSLLLSSIIKICLILNEASLEAFALVMVLDSIILAMGYVYFFLNKSTFNIQNFIFKKETAISLLKDSWPLIFSGIVLMFQARIDQVMLQEMIGSVEVGYYSLAMRLIEFFGFAPMILNGSIFPALVFAKNTSEELYKDRFLNYYRLSFLLFLFVAIPIFLFSEEIVTLLYGSAYQPAGALLSLMAIRLFFTNTGVARGAFINIENLFKFSFFTMTFGAIVNIVLNYYLIPEYKSQGAIVATIISFFVTTFFIDFIYIKTRDNVKLQAIGMLSFYKINIRNKDAE